MTTVTAQRIEELLNPRPPDPNDTATWLIQPMEEVQQAAATAPEGPLMVIAGAGTGKTRALGNRGLHLAKAGASPHNITMLTFNARAAQRLRAELSPCIGADPVSVGFFIGTMHKYCSALLRQAGWKFAGINPGFSICDQEQSVSILEEVIAQDAPDQPPKYTRTQLYHVLQWFNLNRSRDPGEATPPQDKVWDEYIQRYQTEKRRQQLLDFTDLLTLTRDALESDRHLRETYANIRSRHLIVDEFQDLTPLQYQLIRLMTGPTRSVSVALDPNQSIYQWRGADPDLFRRFNFDYHGATVRGLSVNHRTSARIMRAWRAMTQHPLMTGLVDDAQTGLRPGEHRPEENCVDGLPHAQYAAIAEHIHRLITERDYQPGQIAVLARRKATVERMTTQLDSRDVPYVILGEQTGRQDPNAQCVTAMLTLAVNPNNSWALRKAADCNVTQTNRNLNPIINRDIQAVARERSANLIDAARVIKGKVNSETAIYLQLAYAIETWEGLQGMLDQDNTPAADLIRYIHDQMYLHGTGRAQRQLPPPISRLITIADRNDRAHPGQDARRRLSAYLEALTNALNPDEQSEETDDPFRSQRGVALATVYGSKGLQWPVVFFADCAAHIVPGDRVKENTPRMNEEQRLFYVGVTRAEDRLYCYWSRQQDDGSEAAPSPFIETLIG